jgi:hypothetical protein
MMAKVMEGRPAKMGFRMPAEWEPHEQCWMGWPVRTPPSPASSSPICPVLVLRSSCVVSPFRCHPRECLTRAHALTRMARWNQILSSRKWKVLLFYLL